MDILTEIKEFIALTKVDGCNDSTTKLLTSAATEIKRLTSACDVLSKIITDMHANVVVHF